ncbi:MAG: DinB family protein [Trueperaceae bacterium]|nr:DinB family protein [Trueperaceae bacterium]
MQTTDLHRMLAYLDWANAAMLTGARTLDDDVLRADVGSSFGSIHGTLQHMLWAERLWFERWARGADPDDYAAPDDLGSLQEAWQVLAEERRTWFEALDERAAEEEVPFQHFRDGEQRAVLSDLVQHVITHASFHRGQVVGMMRQAGVTPPATGMRTFMAARG